MNDLERPVFEKFVFLAELKIWLLKQPEVGAALMSGSGSTVFAVLRDRADADHLATRAKIELDPELWTCGSQTREADFRGRMRLACGEAGPALAKFRFWVSLFAVWAK